MEREMAFVEMSSERYAVCLDLCLRRATKGKCGVLLASHPFPANGSVSVVMLAQGIQDMWVCQQLWQ